MLSTTFTEENFYPEFFNIVEPDCFSLSALDNDTAHKFSLKLKESLIKYKPHVQQQLSNVIKWLDSSDYDPNLHQRCIKELALRDQIRNKYFVDYIPELAHIL
jgi:hypothetical protein